MRPGERLKKLREDLRLSIREVERRSQRLAAKKGNASYLVSHSWLRILESGRYVPGIHKFYSLSVIYHRDCEEIIGLFGVNFADAAKDQAMFGWPHTHPIGTAGGGDTDTIPFPLRARNEFQAESTQLITRLIQVWGDVPIALIRQLDVRKSLYGYLGLNDFSLFPIVLPGSFLQIDPTETKVKAGAWEHALERPIYFLDLRDRYACGWCELKDGQLSLVPHVASRQSIRRYAHPQDAEVIGRVTGVAMKIADGGTSPWKRLARGSGAVP